MSPPSLLPRRAAGRSARAALSATAALVAALHAGPATADAPRSARPALVLIAPQIEGTDLDDRAVKIVAAHLRPLDVTVSIVRPEKAARDLAGLRSDAGALLEGAGARGALWIDAAREDDLGLYALGRGAGALHGRRITTSPGKTAAALESLAGIAAAVAEELVQGRDSGLAKIDVPAASPADSAAPRPAPAAPREGGPSEAAPRDDAAASTTKPAAPPPDAPAPSSLAISAGYVGGTFGSGVPWQNGASLRLSIAPVSGLYVGAGYEVIAPSRIALGPSFGVTMERHPVLAGGGYRFTFGRAFELQLGARASFDVVQRTPEVIDLPVFGQPPPPGGDGGWHHGAPPPPPGPGPSLTPRTDLVISAAPVVEAFFRLAGGLRLHAMLGVDFPFSTSALSGPPVPPPALDAARFLAGLGLELGLALPSSSRPFQMASR